jgi:hypothetical protein
MWLSIGKTEIAEPENTAFARLRLNKHVSALKDTHDIVGSFGSSVFYAVRAEDMQVSIGKFADQAKNEMLD